MFQTDPGVLAGVNHSKSRSDNSIPFLLVVLNPSESADDEVAYWRKQLKYNGQAVAVHPRGGGGYRWTTKNPPNTIERSMALLGQTVDTGRVRDLVALFGKLGDMDREVRLVGRGPAGVLAAYAAPYFAPAQLMEVVILDPPTSHRDGPHFLNVDRVLDLPTALGLLAPDAKLTLINAKDPAFDKTAAIYKLAGVADKFERK